MRPLKKYKSWRMENTGYMTSFKKPGLSYSTYLELYEHNAFNRMIDLVFKFPKSKILETSLFRFFSKVQKNKYLPHL